VNARLPAELGDLSWWNAAHLRTLRDIDETRAAQRLTTAARATAAALCRPRHRGRRKPGADPHRAGRTRPARRTPAVLTRAYTAAMAIEPEPDRYRRLAALIPACLLPADT
jgi:hypothetical protein